MQQLGKYEIHEELGRGGFGAVYRAVDTTLKREVALKVLNPALLHEEGWLARFRREAQVIAALDHPRIVTVHEIAEVNHRAFICMNLLRGPSLDQVLAERGALPWDETRRVMQQVLEALAYAHAKGVLHRDLKPANIVLDAEKGAVLTDFGFARLVGDTSLSLSVSGGLVGSPHYIAPELWHEQPPSPASDLYALGSVLYEMVLGRKAFPGETSPAVMMAHFQPLNLPETWPEGTPPGIADVLRRSLAQEPEARYATAPDMAEALRALQVDPYAESYTALQAAVDAGNWPKALTLTEQLHAQAPDYRDVAALLEQAKAETTRADLIAQWRTQAETALEAGQLQAARAAAEQWRRLAPKDQEAKALLEQVGSALKEKAEEPDKTERTEEKREQLRPQAEAKRQKGKESSERKDSAETAEDTESAHEASKATSSGQPIPEKPKRPPTWIWVLVGIGLLIGAIWLISDLNTVEVITVTVERTVEVERLVTQTPSNPSTDSYTEAPTSTGAAGVATETSKSTTTTESAVFATNTPTIVPTPTPSPIPTSSSVLPASIGTEDTGSQVNTREIYIEFEDGSKDYLTDNEAIDSEPKFSPGGNQIAFVRTVDTNNDGEVNFDDTSDIYVMDIDGDNTRNLTDHPSEDLMVSWSPDGEYLVFYSNRSGSGEVYLLNLFSKEVQQLTYGSGWGAHARWSPDGEYIAFYTSDRNGSYVTTIRPDGSGLQQLTDAVGNGWGIGWTTDNLISFPYQEKGHYVIGPDGSGLRPKSESDDLIWQSEYGWWNK